MGTKGSGPSPRDETLSHRFDSVVATQGRRVAILEGTVELTYRDIADRAARLASALVATGIRPRDVVSWQLPNWWEAVVIHHAAVRVGAISNPLNPSFRERELSSVLRQAPPRALFVPQHFRGFDHLGLARALAAPETVLVSVRGAGENGAGVTAFDDLTTASPSPPSHAGDPGAPAVLLYTSGTSGDPKGVLHAHRSLLCEIDSFPRIHHLDARDRLLGGAPVHHVAGLVYGVMAPFAIGTSTAFLPRWDAAHALDLIHSARATYQTGPPAFLLTLADEARARPRDVSSFRLFSTGGATIPADAVAEAGAALGCTVKRAYGSTEVPTLTATLPDDPEEERLRTDGRAIAPGEARVVTPAGVDARGAEGEIWARAPEMFLRYLDARLTARAVTDEGWFRTGDLGTLDARGLLRVTGRLTDTIIRGGENIGTAEVEALLLEHPDVLEVAVVGVPDPVLGERACAVVRPRPGSSPSLETLCGFLRGRGLAPHKLPERLVLRDRLPKTAVGKVRKAELRAQLS